MENANSLIHKLNITAQLDAQHLKLLRSAKAESFSNNIHRRKTKVWRKNYSSERVRFCFITTNKCTINVTAVSFYIINYCMFRHIYVIIREFYICALLSYINS
jgi:hypothetical protein